MKTCPRCHGARKLWPGPATSSCAICGQVGQCPHRDSGLAVWCPDCRGAGVVGDTARRQPAAAAAAAAASDVDEWVTTRNAIATEWSLRTTAITTFDTLLADALETLQESASDEQVPLVASIRDGLATYRKQTAWLTQAVVALDNTATEVLRNRNLIE